MGALLLLAAVAVWVPGSDVVQLVAEQDAVLLGRYEENRVYLGLLISPLCIVAGLILLSRVALDRLLAFKVLAVVLAAALAFVVVDVADRLVRKPRYEATAVSKLDKWPHKWKKRGEVRTRPPDKQYRVRYDDEPSTDRTYPDPPAGFASGEVTLTVDGRGFRNPAAVDRADVIVLGDSFAEGSRVDDAEVWGRRLEGELGRPVYNLAISGTSPQNYLNHFLAFGVDLAPRVVLCMIYEGNDLKVHSADEEAEASAFERAYDAVKDVVKDSPVIEAARDFVDDQFGAMRTDGPVAGWDALSWMPLRIEGPEGVHHVAFEPKRLERLHFTPERFRKYKGWKRAREVFTDLKRACDEAGVPLVFVYAPSAPHVLLPLVLESIPAEGLHQFLAYAEDDLASPEELKRSVPEWIETCEDGFAEFAASIGAEVIRPTAALRAAAATGRQVYYTYDQHWTRHGHEVVAAEVLAWFRARPELLSGS